MYTAQEVLRSGDFRILDGWNHRPIYGGSRHAEVEAELCNLE